MRMRKVTITRRITFVAITFIALIYIISMNSYYLSADMLQIRSCRKNSSSQISYQHNKGLWLDRIIVNNTIPQWLDTWISKGEFDPSSYLYPGEKSSSPLLAEERRVRFNQIKFDVIYTWVNGSDERHRKLREIYKVKNVNKKKKDSSNSENRYRDYDELRYSVRSVESFFGRFINKIFIIATDFANNKVTEKSSIHNGSEESLSDMMQIPTWLNVTWKDCVTGEPRVQMVRHSEIFNNISVLPTFNSLAIESQMMNIRDLSDQVLYLNDDQFFGKNLSPIDFWTPLYGQVFHIEHHLTVPPNFRGSVEEGGEWYALRYSNELLSKRFGSRHRPYVSHAVHPLSTSILRSIVAEFPEEFLSTSTHRFRNTALDMHTTFFFTHYVMEKHREALLRSFLIYKMDANHNMRYELSERRAILKALGNDGYTSGANRKTLEDYRSILERAEIHKTEETRYMWSSMDGHAYAVSSPIQINPREKKLPVPQFFNPEKHPPETRSCKLGLEYCFGSEFLSSDENTVVEVENIFKEVAVRKIECGDCIIQHLVARSGEKGLEAFLPSDTKDESRGKNEDESGGKNEDESGGKNEDESGGKNEDENKVVESTNDSDSVSEKDINSTHTSSTILDSRVPMSYRTFAITEISRYSYVIGGTSFQFVYLDFPKQTWNRLKQLSEQKPSVFCINDDVGSNDSDLNQIRKYVNQFLHENFKNRSIYEILEEKDSDGIWGWIKKLYST